MPRYIQKVLRVGETSRKSKKKSSKHVTFDLGVDENKRSTGTGSTKAPPPPGTTETKAAGEENNGKGQGRGVLTPPPTPPLPPPPIMAEAEAKTKYEAPKTPQRRTSHHRKSASTGTAGIFSLPTPRGAVGVSELKHKLRPSRSDPELSPSRSYPDIRITITNYDSDHALATQPPLQNVRPVSIHSSSELSLKTRKRSYATRSMGHRFASIGEGVMSVLEHAKNNLKPPQIWEWKFEPLGVGLGREERGVKRGLKGQKQEDGEQEVEGEGDRFPYVGNWRAGARVRYLRRTAPEGPGFVAVAGSARQSHSPELMGSSTEEKEKEKNQQHGEDNSDAELERLLSRF